VFRMCGPAWIVYPLNLWVIVELLR
jgi:hypothetical protein